MDPISTTILGTIVFGTAALITKGLRAQNKKRKHVMKTVLAEFGFHAQGNAFHGRIAGHPAVIKNTTSLSPLLTVQLSPPLDLGLIANDSPSNVPYEIPFAHDQPFAGGYEVIAKEESRAHQLFNNKVRRFLRSRRGGGQLQIEDGFIRCPLRWQIRAQEEPQENLRLRGALRRGPTERRGRPGIAPPRTPVAQDRP